MVRILTDSTCDIPPQRQKELDIEVVPLSVHFGPETYQDGVDLTNQEFYAKLRQAETLPGADGGGGLHPPGPGPGRPGDL